MLVLHELRVGKWGWFQQGGILHQTHEKSRMISKVSGHALHACEIWTSWIAASECAKATGLVKENESTSQMHM